MNIVKNTYIYLNRFIKKEINYYCTKPTNLLLFLTYRCTSRCKACTMWQRGQKTNPSDELSLQEWKDFIDMVSDKGIKNIEMFGGDALLRKDVLIPLTDYARKKGIPEIDFPTNCNLMDEKTANALVDAGVTAVSTSLDAVGELHDQMRGAPGAFNRVKRSIEYLVKAKKGRKYPEIVVNCTISSLNIDSFEKVLPFAEKIGADTVAFEYAGEFPLESLDKSKIDGRKPEPYFIPQGKSILLNKEQAVLLKRKVKAIKEKRKNMKIYVVTKNIDVLTIENLITGIFPNKRCYMSRYLITVDPYGNIIPCPFFNNYYMGNIKEKNFDSIWNNGRHRKFMKYVDKGKLDLCRYCILGVERNPTFFQSIRKAYFIFTGRGFDE